VRVLILSTPFDARARLDGSRLAVADLIAGMRGNHGLAPMAPTVLVAEGGVAPEGARTIAVGKSARAEVMLATALADVDVIHAWFAPRLVTSAVLSAIRRARGVPIVQTVASIPRSWSLVSGAIVGDVIVPTSDATAIALATRGVDARKMARVPAPFAHVTEVVRETNAPRDLLLYAGDWEFDDGVERTLYAFARMAPPRGVTPHLAIASRGKTREAEHAEERARRKIASTTALRGRVTILGEVPSLLPWIAAARGVLVPASTTYAKLDHPRVLLEAMALGVRVIVGSAPSLAELVDDPRVGEIAESPSELREAMERCFELDPPPAEAVLRVLGNRRPSVVAARYRELYERAITSRPR